MTSNPSPFRAAAPLAGRSPLPATLDPRLDPGLATVRLAHDTLGLDAPWSLRGGRGFTSRASGLTQRIWSEPGHDDLGMRRYRVHAETDVVRDLVDVEAALVTTNLLNSIGSLGALVIDPVRGTVTHRVSAWVTAGSLDRIARRFAVGAAVQVPEAASAARLLGDVAGGQVHVSRHRGAAARVDEQDPLGFDQLVASAGRARSRWDDGSLVRAQEDLGQGAMAGRIVVSDHAFSMPIPFAHDVAYLQAVTTEAHPILGHGLMVRLSLPDGATEHADAATAAELNRLEVDSWSRSHLMGAWVAQSGRIHHVAFHPNLAYHGEGDASSILRCGVRRAHWSADVLG